MATYRFGSSLTARKNAGDIVGCRKEEENDLKDDGDPDRLLQCPYDKNHQIRACRFPYHLNKCGKNYPNLAKKLKVCPFNATHRILPQEFSEHLANCEDKQSTVAIKCGSNKQNKQQDPVNTGFSHHCQEDWDKEVEEEPEESFIWKASNIQLDSRPQHSPSPRPCAARPFPWKE